MDTEQWGNLVSSQVAQAPDVQGDWEMCSNALQSGGVRPVSVSVPDSWRVHAGGQQAQKNLTWINGLRHHTDLDQLREAALTQALVFGEFRVHVQDVEAINASRLQTALWCARTAARVAEQVQGEQLLATVSRAEAKLADLLLECWSVPRHEVPPDGYHDRTWCIPRCRLYLDLPRMWRWV